MIEVKEDEDPELIELFDIYLKSAEASDGQTGTTDVRYV